MSQSRSRECAICMEIRPEADFVALLCCGAAYCRRCAFRWNSRAPSFTCPSCRHACRTDPVPGVTENPLLYLPDPEVPAAPPIPHGHHHRRAGSAMTPRARLAAALACACALTGTVAVAVHYLALEALYWSRIEG